jgi:hypothetical protein
MFIFSSMSVMPRRCCCLEVREMLLCQAELVAQRSKSCNVTHQFMRPRASEGHHPRFLERFSSSDDMARKAMTFGMFVQGNAGMTHRFHNQVKS